MADTLFLAPVVIRLKLYIVIRFARKVCLLLMIGKLPVSCIKNKKSCTQLKCPCRWTRCQATWKVELIALHINAISLLESVLFLKWFWHTGYEMCYFFRNGQNINNINMLCWATFKIWSNSMIQCRDESSRISGGRRKGYTFFKILGKGTLSSYTKYQWVPQWTPWE